MTRDEAETLLASVLPMIRGMASRYARRTHLPKEDLVQVGMIAAWRRLEDYDPTTGCTLQGFLCNRVLGAFIDHQRQQQHSLGWQYRRGSQSMPAAESLGAAPADYRRDIDQHEPEEFERLIRPLTSRERAVVRMIYRSGMGHQEIATELHCAPSTVSYILSHALAFLREHWSAAA